MISSKLTVFLALTIFMLGASAAPVTGPDSEPASKVPGPRPQKRGYDGDWLFSRESELALTVEPPVAEGKTVVVHAENKRDEDANASAPSLSTAK